jgi:hypothetical protein
MQTYNFSDLLKMKTLPDDVDSYVIEQIQPAIDKFPQISQEIKNLMEYAKRERVYTDKTRAIIICPMTKKPLITLEYHYGVIKQFSYAKFFGDLCYLPINLKNMKVAFKGGTNG